MGEAEAEHVAGLLRVWRELEDEGASVRLLVVDQADWARGRSRKRRKMRTQGGGLEGSDEMVVG